MQTYVLYYFENTNTNTNTLHLHPKSLRTITILKHIYKSERKEAADQSRIGSEGMRKQNPNESTLWCCRAYS